MEEPVVIPPKDREAANLPQLRAEPSGHAPHPAATAPVPRRRRSMFWPVSLITFGVLLLLSNMGVIPATGWAVLWRFWPIALVALGIDVLIGRRSVAGAIASGLLTLVLVGIAIAIALFAENVPALVELARPAALTIDSIEHPLGTTEEAVVTIDWTSAPARLHALDDSSNLIEADIAYRGELLFQVAANEARTEVTLDTVLQGIPYASLGFDDKAHHWDVRLSPEVILDLNLDAGSGSATFDLSDLNVRSLDLDAGSGAIELLLPTMHEFEGEVDGGSGSLVIRLPEDMGLRIRLDGGSGGFSAGSRLTRVSGDPDNGTWETEGFDLADQQAELTIDQGSGSLRIE